MSTLAQIITDRATAGARYAAAVVELKASMIALSAIETALTNKHVQNTPGVEGTANDPALSVSPGGGSFGTVPMLTFGGNWPDPISLRHPVYAPSVGGHWQSEANAAHKVIVAALS